MWTRSLLYVRWSVIQEQSGNHVPQADFPLLIHVQFVPSYTPSKKSTILTSPKRFWIASGRATIQPEGGDEPTDWSEPACFARCHQHNINCCVRLPWD